MQSDDATTLGGTKYFQYLLQNNAALNERYHNKAFEIAAGLQPWIDQTSSRKKKALLP